MKDNIITYLKENFIIDIEPKLDYDWPTSLTLKLTTKVYLDKELIFEDIKLDSIGGVFNRSNDY